MFRPWALGASLVVISVILLPFQYGYSETGLLQPQAALPAPQVQPAAVAPAADGASLALPVRSRNAAEVDAVREVAVGLADPEAQLHRMLPFRSVRPSAVQVVEPSRRMTLEELHRSLFRYPDHDLAGRLCEQATERMPLFGEDD